MKPFNVFIILFLIVIAFGLVFFKDGFRFLSYQSPVTSQQQLVDRMTYLDYSESNRALAQKYGKTVLFFAATTWCQTCSQLDKEIKERITDIPSDITILKVDYDNDLKMKVKYTVTQQHTLVILDRNGNELKRWIGGNFDLMLNELKEI